MLWYLAHPYSGNVEANMASVNSIAAHLFVRRFMFYSPLSMTHPIHLTGLSLKLYEGERWEDWLRFDEEMMRRCDGLLLCPGWEASKGCLRELAFFQAAGKPVFLVDHEGLLSNLSEASP